MTAHGSNGATSAGHCDRDLEAALVGCVLLSGWHNAPDVADAALAEVAVDDFAYPVWRAAWASCGALRARGLAVDPLLVADLMPQHGWAVAVHDDLAHAAHLALAPSVWRAYLGQLREHRQRTRAQVEVSKLMADLGQGDLAETGEALARLGEALLSSAADAPADAAALAADVWREAEAASRGEASLLALPGWTAVTRAIGGGLEPGEALLVGGRTSSGKSTLLRCWAAALARKGVAVGILSLEDTARTWMRRCAAEEAEVPAEKIRTGRMSGDEWSRLAAARGTLARWPLRVLWLGQCSAARAVGGLCRLAGAGARLLIVDYVQQIREPTSRRDRADDVGAAFGALKTAAGRLGLPIVIATQWSREASKSDSAPGLWAAKESGDVENQAEAVAWLWRPIRARADWPEERVDLLVLKSKNAPPGTVRLAFDRDHNRLREEADDWSDGSRVDGKRAAAGDAP